MSVTCNCCTSSWCSSQKNMYKNLDQWLIVGDCPAYFLSVFKWQTAPHCKKPRDSFFTCSLWEAGYLQRRQKGKTREVFWLCFLLCCGQQCQEDLFVRKVILKWLDEEQHKNPALERLKRGKLLVFSNPPKSAADFTISLWKWAILSQLKLFALSPFIFIRKIESIYLNVRLRGH